MLSKSFLLLALVAVNLFKFAKPQAEEYGPDNNRCVNAFMAYNEIEYMDSNFNATFDFINQGTCGPRSDRASVWYKVTGIGEMATASVCSNNGVVTDFGLLNKCNSNAKDDCNGYPDSELALCDNNEAVTYSWRAEDGVDYFVHIRADGVSEFTLVVTGVMEEPEEAPSGGPVPNSAGSKSIIDFFFSTVLSWAICLFF